MFRLNISGNFFLVLRDSDQFEHIRHPRSDTRYITFDEGTADPLIRFEGIVDDLDPKLSNQEEFRLSELRDNSGASFADFATLRTFLDSNLGNNSGGGNGGGVVPTQDHIFANIAERDTHFSTRLTELISGTPIFVGNITLPQGGTGTVLQEWGGGSNPSSYDSTQWVQGSIIASTAAEIKTLYESNADTNAFTDALLAKLNGIESGATGDLDASEIKTLYESNADTNAFTDNFQNLLNSMSAGNLMSEFIPYKVGNYEYRESALRQAPNRIVSSLSIEAPDASLFLGAQRLSNSGFGVFLQNMANNEVSYPVAVDLENAGSSIPYAWMFGATVPTPAAADKSETFTSNSIQFITPSTANGIATAYTFDSTIATTDVNLVIRLNSHTDPNPIFDYKRATGGIGFNMVIGENTLQLPIPLFFEEGQVLFATVESPNGLSLRGQTISGQTIPYIGVSGRVAIRELMATRNWVNSLISSGTDTTHGSITSFSIDGFSTAVDTGFNIAGNRTFRFTVNNPSLFQGSLEILQDGAVIQSNIAPTTTSVTVAVNSVILNNIGDSATFTLRGTNTEGDVQTRNYVVHVTGSSELVYYGLSTINNPATVQLGSLESQRVGSGRLTVDTGAVTQSWFFMILVPSDHDIHTIFDTVFNQDVTNVFTRTNNVRVIGSENYISYVIGPLNADADGETYILNLL